MAGVDFSYVIPPALGAGATRYQDTFNRADQPFFLGNNWAMQCSESCGNAPSAMAAGVNVSASPSFATIGTAAGSVARSLFIPAFVSRQRITTLMLARGQYSQFTIKNVLAGVSCSVGPVVYNPNPNDGNCYILILQSNGQSSDLFRGVGAGAAAIVPNVFNWVVGDVIRLEVTPGVADNTIRCYKNGVLQNTFVDNNASRPQGGGMYGIGWFSSNVGTLSFADYDGGLL